MYRYFFLYMPCIVTLCGTFMVILKRMFTDVDRYFVSLSLVAAIYLFVDVAYISPLHKYQMMMVADAFGKGSSLAILPLVFLWVREQLGRRHANIWIQALLFIIPVFFFCTTAILYYKMGPNQSQMLINQVFSSPGLSFRSTFAFPLMNLYLKVSFIAFLYILVLEVVLLLCYMLYEIVTLFRSRHRNQYTRIIISSMLLFLALLLIIGVRVGLGYRFLMLHVYVSCALSLLLAIDIFAICYTALHAALLTESTKVAIRDMGEVQRQGYSLRTEFERIMLTEGMCYRQGVNAEQISTMLGTNRTYLSRMMQSFYEMDLQTWVRFHRITRSQQILMAEENIKQSELAERVGYTDAPTFNKNFKIVTGLTPREWMAISQSNKGNDRGVQNILHNLGTKTKRARTREAVSEDNADSQK